MKSGAVSKVTYNAVISMLNAQNVSILLRLFLEKILARSVNVPST